MKKIIFSSFSFLLAIGVLTSCGKATKGKVSHEWKVTSYSAQESYGYPGSMSSSSETGDENSMTRKDVDENGDITTYKGEIFENTITINKDGSWSSVLRKSVTHDEDLGFGNTTATITRDRTSEASGSWSLMGKNKSGDFKKNERIVFYTSSNKVTTNQTTVTHSSMGDQTTTSSSTETNKYDGIGSSEGTIWVVEESKGKLLKLKRELKETDGDGYVENSTYSQTLER